LLPTGRNPVLYIDIETRSRVEIGDVGVHRYVEDPDFKILMAGWAVDNDEPQLVTEPEAMMEIPGLWDPGVPKVAHNAQFERVCFSTMGPQRIEDWIDTAVLASEAGLPRSLDKLAKALGVAEKDSAGTRLINFFCKPRKDGTFNQPEDHPDKWLDFCEYCCQDVRTLIEAHQKLPDWPTETERLLYLADQAINDRGIKVDIELARAAKKAADLNSEATAREVCRITGISNANSNPQLMEWFGGLVPNLQAETVQEALRRKDITPEQRRVLELRQELALVASKKYTAVLQSVNKDNRLRGLLKFFGAHTGRWAGRGVQIHNLPRASMHSPADEALAIDDLKAGLGADAHTLKALVRSMFLGPMVVSDYSAIEARVLAWLAEERWVLEAFIDGRDIYVETANRMGGLTRFQGKVAVLALGYNGSITSLRAMGAEGEDEELQKLVYQWRNANPRIVKFWGKVEEAFKHGGRAGKITVEAAGDRRSIRLPSGRALVYHKVKATTQVGPDGKPRTRLSFLSPMGYRTDTYGGRLTENITQAVARDVLGDAIIRLEAYGLPVVAHIHDEVLVETERLNRVKELMVRRPDWAPDLPLAVEAFITERYRKG
jgi:DNA polymerase